MSRHKFRVRQRSASFGCSAEFVALAAEGTVMAMLMVMGAICALGSLIGVLIVKSNLYRRTAR